MRILKMAGYAGRSALAAGILLALAQPAQANKELEKLSRQNTNWCDADQRL